MAVVALLGCYVIVYALFWLPASIVVRRTLGDRLRREWMLDLFSLVFGLLVGYATFWLYLLDNRLGLAASCLLLGAACAVVVFRRWIDPGPLRRHVSAPVRVAFLLGLLYLGGVSLFGGIERAQTSYVPGSTLDVPSAYFWLMWRAGDELIPVKFAQALATAGPLRGAMVNFPAQWQFSDRPPLQSGVLLVFWPLAWIARVSVLGQAAGTMLQVQWVLALAGLAGALCWGRRRLSFVVLLVGLSGLGYYNAVFVWPKLLTAALSIAAAAPLAAAWRGRRALGDLETLLAASAAALAMLAHGGAAFTLLPVALLALGHRPLVRLRTIVPAAVVAALLYVPWSAYQVWVDPPGNRCTRWMLAGKTEPGDTPLSADLRDAYSNTTLRQWLDDRARGLRYLVGFPELDANIVRCLRGIADPSYRPAEPFLEQNLYYLRANQLAYDAKTLAALLRYDQNEHVFRALGLLNLAWPLLAWRLLRGPSLRRSGLGLLLAATAMSLLIWWLLVFQPLWLSIRGASMAMMLGLMAIAALVIFDLGPVARWTVAGLQMLSAAVLWVYFVPTDFARQSLELDARPQWTPLVAALVSLAGVLYYCLSAGLRYPRRAEKRGHPSFAGTARRVLRTNEGCPLFSELAAGVGAAIAFVLLAGAAIHRKSPLAELGRRDCITPTGVILNVVTQDIEGTLALFDGVSDRMDNYATWTFHEPLLIRFRKPQRLAEIRLHLYDFDGRNYRFQVELQRGGRWSMLLDRSKQGAGGLVAIPLEPAPTSALRIIGLHNSVQEVNPANNLMHLKELDLIPAP